MAEQLRHFRLSEARAMRPDVDTCLDAMQRERKRAAEARALIDAVRRSGTSNGNGSGSGHAPGNDELRRRFQRHAERLQELGAELESMGVQVKDLERGLVDWPAQRDGATVLLCWLRGEPEIAFWHDLQSGFAGRQAIVEEEWD